MKLLIVVLLCLAASAAHAASQRDVYYAHPVREDAHGVIAPWHEGQNGQLDERLRIAMAAGRFAGSRTSS